MSDAAASLADRPAITPASARRPSPLALAAALVALALPGSGEARVVVPHAGAGHAGSIAASAVRSDSAPVGERGVVSAADPRAAAAGAQILRQGGSATDAAIAMMLALTVVEPQSSGIGGGGFLVTGTPRGVVQTYDGREKAPKADGPDLFLVGGKPMPFSEAQPGGKSTGVPGSLRLVALAHAQHGKLPWRALFRPAIALAQGGFTVTRRLHDELVEFPATGALDPAARAIYYRADGQAQPIGATIRNPALAQTLEALATRGADSFYGGANARAIVAKVSGAAHNPAPMTAADLAGMTAKERAPVCAPYRSYRVCGMGPPSSGATTVYAILKQLERFDLHALGPKNPVAWHLIAESERLAYADRNTYLGDSDFVKVPIKGLTDAGYLASRSALISADHAMPSVAAGMPPHAEARSVGTGYVEHGTTHFVAIDKWGNAATYTSTIESAFGSGLMVGGYYLNNELTDFDMVPDKDGAPVANRVEGGKRPRSSMSPTLIYNAQGKLVLAVGAAGGYTIPAQVAKAIIGVLDFRLPAKEAIALPLILAPGGDMVGYEKGTWLETIVPQLQAMGHADVRAMPWYLKANAVERVTSHGVERWKGAADVRSEGVAEAE